MRSCISCSRYRTHKPDRRTACRVFWCEILFPGTNYSHASTRASFLLAARAHTEQMRCWFTLPLVALLMEAEATINRITTHPEHQSERSLSDSIHLQQISSYFTQIIHSESCYFFFSLLLLYLNGSRKGRGTHIIPHHAVKQSYFKPTEWKYARAKNGVPLHVRQARLTICAKLLFSAD